MAFLDLRGFDIVDHDQIAVSAAAVALTTAEIFDTDAGGTSIACDAVLLTVGSAGGIYLVGDKTTPASTRGIPVAAGDSILVDGPGGQLLGVKAIRQTVDTTLNVTLLKS